MGRAGGEPALSGLRGAGPLRQARSFPGVHFAERIDIQRVICHTCGTTHAMIPRFSVPDTSLGTEEAEQSLLTRAAGDSRSEAARPLVARAWKGGPGGTWRRCWTQR